MGRPKSLLVSMHITIAGKSHDCRFNNQHRIAKGDRRLTIREDGSEHHYCLNCAQKFIERDTVRLRDLHSSVADVQPEKVNL